MIVENLGRPVGIDQDRRSQIRSPLTSLISIRDGDSRPASLLDISAGGVSLVCQHPSPVGAEVDVMFFEEKIYIPGVVLYQRPWGDFGVRVGVRFEKEETDVVSAVLSASGHPS